MSALPTSPDGRRWIDGFRIGDRVVFYGKPGTITSYHPAATTADEWGEVEPEFWGVTLDNEEWRLADFGYINEFDFLV